MAADEALRWSDDGKTAVEPVSDEHRTVAANVLFSRGARAMKQQRS
jgi:hypothetical protein